MNTARPTDHDQDVRSLEQVLDGMRFAMVTTSGPGGLRARPLTLLEQEDATLRFLVSTESEWVQELTEPLASAQVTFVDSSDHTYVALQAHARIVRDRDAVARLWNPAAEAFFEGPDDPAVAVLECEVFDGEWWDAPGSKLGMAVSFLKQLVTGEEPGSSGSVEAEPEV
jgi:general stress protein 26